MTCTHGRLDFLFDVVDYPRRSIDCPDRLTIIVFLIIYVKFNFQCFRFCWIKINLFFYKTVNIGIVYSEFKDVQWIRLIVDPNFLYGR